MFNLNDTGHEAGIILYGDDTVGAYNWSSFADGFIPMVSPFGFILPWPTDAGEDIELVNVEHVDDVRSHLPGTVWMGEDGLDTDMDIVYDENYDIPALWGFGQNADYYAGVDSPYAGDIWEIPGEKIRVITIDTWN